MASRGQTRRRRTGREAAEDRREWIGGCLSPPFFVQEGEEPQRAEIVLWMDAASGVVVGQEATVPEDAAAALIRVLRDALKRPLTGPPDAIRVSDPSLAADVRAVVGDAIPVLVAPTPELDALMEHLLESMPDEDESYLDGGRLSPAAVGRMFSTARLLYQMAPWKVVSEHQVLRMDIPALDVEGACVSIIGELGQSRGIIIFPSLAAYEAFVNAAEEPVLKNGSIDLGTGFLSLSFERGADLPASMRREVEAHGWPVDWTDAYPRVAHRDPDGVPRPLVEKNLKIVSACATSLSVFFLKHKWVFETDEFEPVCESFYDNDDLEVRFTVPYEASSFFQIEPDPAGDEPRNAQGDKVGRNDPCPCGSGRKYKKCHLREEKKTRSEGVEADPAHDLDSRVVERLLGFALARYESEWSRHREDFADPEGAHQLSIPWSLYHHSIRGATVLDRYLEERGGNLSRAETAWLSAQKGAWLSVWEVTGVEDGTHLMLRDLLSHETRRVHEVSGSRTLVARDALLARVVDHEGVSLLCGVHPRPLPPYEAAEVVRRARGRLRRKRSVPVENLRDESLGRYLIRRWEDAVASMDDAPAIPRELRNGDGHPLVLTTDHFTIAPGTRRAVEVKLSAMEGVQASDSDSQSCVYDFLRAGSAMIAGLESTVIGRARLSDTALRIETNSRERADELRARIERVCGDRIRHRAREHEDPLSSKSRLRARKEDAASEPEPPPPEIQQALLEYKERHYADWVDHALPALGGMSPREATRTAEGRAAVDVLLKDMENHEQRIRTGAAFDFSRIRRQLRLE